MIELLAAIVARFNICEVADRVNGLHLFRAPQSDPANRERDYPRPYVTFFPVTNTPDRALDDAIVEGTVVQFSIWSDAASAEEPLTIYKLLDDAFDGATLEIAGGRTLSVLRQSNNLLEDPDGGWHYQADYLIRHEED